MEKNMSEEMKSPYRAANVDVHDSHSVMDAFAASQGWNESTQLALLLIFVDNLADQVSLREFLQHRVNTENLVRGVTEASEPHEPS